MLVKIPDSVGLTRLLDTCGFIILLGQWSKSQLNFTPENFPKGTNLKAIGLIHGSNLCQDHGYFMAHDKENFFKKFKNTLKNTTPSRAVFYHTPFTL